MAGADHHSLVAALLTVDGVADAAVEPTLEGPGAVSLRLVDGADEDAVALSVDRLLRANFRLALDRMRSMPSPVVARMSEAAPPPALPELDRELLPAMYESEEPEEPEEPEGFAEPEELAVSAEPVLEAPHAPPVAATPAPPALLPRELSRPQSVPPLVSLTVPRASVVDELFARPRENHLPVRAHHAVPHSAARPERRAAGPTRRGSGSPAPTASSSRLSIESVQTVTTGFRVVASVRLSMDGRTYVGEAEGVRAGSARSVAAAALRAVEAAVDTRARFGADYVEFAGANRDQAVVCVVTMVSNGRTERLSGAVAVRDDIPHSVVQAVLAAVNRKVLSLLPGAS